MTNQTTKPIIFLAFANDRQAGGAYLRNLGQEAEQLRKVLTPAEKAGLCQVEIRTSVSAEDVLIPFYDPAAKDRIAIFHYAGHAEDYALQLESATGDQTLVDGRGLAAFLRYQRGLQVVFLNACSTQAQVAGLLDAGVAAVVATSRAIDDRTASDFARHFYTALAGGDSISAAFEKAQAALHFVRGELTRHLRPQQDSQAEHSAAGWPWALYLRKGAEEVAAWNLPGAANDPLFGLDLPAIDLPAAPYPEKLQWYDASYAPVFFGRGQDIRALYNRVTANGGDPIILFYGQSGVGKSSLLAAGLMPRLAAQQSVVYFRRDQNKGLLGSLIAALADTSASTPTGVDVLDLWLQRECALGKPLTILLDQVEELYTRSASAQPNELADFLTALRTLFLDPAQRPQGKLILGFRKEWLAEIDKQLADVHLPRTAVFLRRMDSRGVVEAVLGPTSTPRLQQKYGLQVEAGLAEEVARDLVKDAEAAVAPTLQILLSKLWAEAKQINRTQPLYDRALYDRLRGEGYLLKDFLDQQLKELHAEHAAAVTSGLALDLLAFHTSEHGAAERTRQTLHDTYQHVQATVDGLLQSFQRRYLLVDPAPDQENPARPTRLAHDTLAPLVRARFDESDAPGQRARRILEARALDWANGREGTPLDETDLALVESGQSGMRVWQPDEKRLVQASQRARARGVKEQAETRARELARQRELEQAYADVKEQLSISESQRLAFAARSVTTTAPETALLLACEAVQCNHNTVSEEALRDALDNTFWHVRGLTGHAKSVNSAVFSRNGQSILTASDDGTARLWDASGRALVVFQGHTDSVYSAVLSLDETQILTTSRDGTARLWQLNGQPIRTLTYPTENENHGRPQGCFSPNGQYLLICDGNEAWLWQATGELCWTFRDIKPELSSTMESIMEIFGPAIAMSAKDKAEVRFQIEQIEKTGHSGRIYSAVFSPDSQCILTASADGTARIWDLSGQPVAILRGHEDQVISAVFGSLDGQIILTGSHDKTARLWRRDGELIATLEHTGDVGHLAFSSDGQRLLTAVDGGGRHDAIVRLWNCTGKLLATLEGHAANDWIRDIKFSPDSQQIVTASGDGTARLWNLQGQVLAVFSGHLDRINSATFSPDNQFIVTASYDGTARVWKPVESPLPIVKGHGGVIARAAYSADGMHILTSSQSVTRLWTTAGQHRATYDGWANLFKDDVFSSDGRYLLTEEAKTAQAHLWQLPPDLHWSRGPSQGEYRDSAVKQVSQPAIESAAWPEPTVPVVTFTSPEGQARISQTVISRDGHHILTLAGELAHLWDSEGKLIAALKGPNLPTVHRDYWNNEPTPPDVHFIMFHPARQCVLTASQNGMVWLWSMKGELIISFLTESRTIDNVFSVTFSPDGRRILITVREQAQLWDLRGRRLATLPCRAYKLSNGLFSPDSQRIITVGSTEPDVRLWNGNGKFIAGLETTHMYPDQIVFDRASQYLCITEGNRVKLWDRDGSPLATLTIAPRTAIRYVAFSPNGEHLVTASSDGVAQLWNIREGGALQTTFKGHAGEVNSAMFSPDGRCVLTASSDGTARQFLVQIDDLLAVAVTRIGRHLAAEEITRFNVPMPLKFQQAS